ncbi:MAG: TldD/PmbA family protein [Alphaproteobacteria bacterium]|nr:TldD/PmbA family protein [Alphaproteobacteria bacterium]
MADNQRNSTLSDLTEALLAAARAAGADAGDALAVSERSQSIEVLSGALEHAERSEGIDIGLRVLVGQRQACVSSSDINPDTIRQMAERAVAMAKEAPEDASIGLATPEQLAKSWDMAALELADPMSEPDPATLQRDALEAEAGALAVKGVAQVEGAGASYSSQSLHLATSNGFSGGYARTGRSISCAAISGEGLSMEQDYCGESRTFQSDLPDATKIGQIAGERAVARIAPKRPPTGAYPVLFDERISSSLIGHFLAAINGASIVRGSSWLRDALGKAVLPKGMSLIEDPLRARVSGSRPFDGEGLAVSAREIVRDGVLTGWTLDLATGRQLGMDSTGNASRGTSSPPSPSSGNMVLTPGASNRADLIAEMGTGLIVTFMIGASINPTTGDYSRGASGLWVENGEITGPVNECTIAGNLREMLLSMQAANDARPHLSRLVPSLLVEGAGA